jgi:hypothetical protein
MPWKRMLAYITGNVNEDLGRLFRQNPRSSSTQWPVHICSKARFISGQSVMRRGRTQVHENI